LTKTRALLLFVNTNICSIHCFHPVLMLVIHLSTTRYMTGTPVGRIGIQIVRDPTWVPMAGLVILGGYSNARSCLDIPSILCCSVTRHDF
jgi:hypothetical protein